MKNMGHVANVLVITVINIAKQNRQKILSNAKHSFKRIIAETM